MKTKLRFIGRLRKNANSTPMQMRCIFLLVAISFTCVTFAQQWQQTKGPYAGYTTAMTAVGGNIYVSNRYYGQGDGRVYRSSDLGQEWVAADGGMASDINFVQQFANIGETILAAANHLYKTTNQGTNWAMKESGLPVQALSIEAIGNDFWAGTNGAGIFKSTNMGESYVAMNTGVLANAGTVIVYDIAYLNGNIFLATEGGGGPARLYRSSNGGASWQLANAGLPLGTNPNHFAVNGSTLFVSSTGDFAENEYGLYKSIDDGDTWTPCNNGIPEVLYGNTGEVFAHDGIVYVSTTYPDASPKVYKSSNNGVSFSAASNGLYNQNQQAYSFTAAGQYLFAGLGWYSAVSRSSDQGANWEESRKGLANATVYSLLDTNERLYAGAQEGLYYTTDMGETWSEMKNGLPYGLPVVTMEKNGANIYLGTDQYGVYRSTDNGSSWTQTNSGLTGTYAENIKDILYFNGALYAATWNGIYKSTNNGSSWTLSSSGLPTAFGGSLEMVNTIIESNGILFAGLSLNRVYKSTDNGAAWTPSGSGILTNASTVYCLLKSGTIIFAATEGGVYKSIDEGNSWQIITTLNNGIYQTLAAGNSGLYASRHGYTVLTGYGIFKSLDNGNTWEEFSPGLYPTSRVMAMHVYNNVLFGATDTRSVWRYEATLATGQLMAKDDRMSVIPNPSNGRFFVAANTAGQAELSIYNMLGQQAYKKLQEPVNGGFDIDISSQSKGIYLVNIKTSEESTSKKIIIE